MADMAVIVNRYPTDIETYFTRFNRCKGLFAAAQGIVKNQFTHNQLLSLAEILAQLSRRPMVRLKTGLSWSWLYAASKQKYPSRSNWKACSGAALAREISALQLSRICKLSGLISRKKSSPSAPGNSALKSRS